MIEFLSNLTFWHWGILSVVLIVTEILLPGVIFLFVGIGAGITAIIVLIKPDLSWQIQLVCFSALAVVSVILGRVWVLKRPIETDKPLLNQRSQQNIGRIVTIIEPIVNGTGSARLDDTVWRVSGANLSAGSKARVIGVDGSVLLVEET